MLCLGEGLGQRMASATQVGRGLGLPPHLCFGEEGLGPRGLLLVGVSLPPAMPSLSPTPSTLLIEIDWFFNVRLKVTSGMLSGLNGRLLVS